MIRAFSAAALSLVMLFATSHAQDAVTRKASRAIHAQEKEILHRITTRIEYDKKLEGATVRVEAKPGGAVILSGTVMNQAAKAWAIELVENTTGVTSVVDELAVVKAVKVYEERTATPVIEVGRPVAVPTESKVIAKP